jgi:histidinol dehydrogenase
MLQELAPDSPILADLLGGVHRRFQRLVEEAERKAKPFYETHLGREASIAEVIEEVFTAVETNGDAAVAHYAKLFDGSSLKAGELRLPMSECERAWKAVPKALQQAMRIAIEQVETYQRKLLPRGFGERLDKPLGVRWLPLRRIGAYVPGGAGGTLPLPSTVIMNLIPAKVAGVKELVLATPARPDGSVAKELLAAAYAVGATEVLRVGGIPAIAALACGTASMPAVDKIVGPGNIYVTLAKRHAYGRVDIDMLAGPSEVLIICDKSAEPAFVAADLLSQAEHDVLAMCICLVVGDGIAESVQTELARQLNELPAERRAVAAESIRRHGVLVRCATIDQAVALSNRIAPEHLEVLVAKPKQVVPRLVNAGAIFVGPWSPEPIGDYVAGPSHTLPTGGTARMWSGIGADTFLKRSSLINLDQRAFTDLAEAGIELARTEGLAAHAQSIAIRQRAITSQRRTAGRRAKRAR